MIQTKFPVIYGARNEKSGVIKIEVRPETPTKEGCEYLVIDFDILDEEAINVGVKDAYFSKKVFKTSAEIDELDSYIESNYSDELLGLGKADKERKKIQIALMLDTQVNLLPSGKTIYGLNPEDWEYSIL